MIDKARAQITTAYTMFVFDFSDPEGLNKSDLEAKCRCPIVELFDKQKLADRAKKNLKTDFSKAVSVYFNNFQTSSGFDAKALKAKLEASEKIFLRHLGKDKVQYLRLLIAVAEALQSVAEPKFEKPRGLLFERAV